jgi:hypothetical protein
MRRRFLVALSAGAWLVSSCTESAKVSEHKATGHVERLAKLADDDVDEVRRGLPRGAKALGAALFGQAGAGPNHGGVCRAMERVRGDDRDLTVAKSTFFAVADDKGIVLCSDQEPDILTGRDVLAAYPPLQKTLSGETVETMGTMPEASVRAGPDEQWLAAAPLRDAAGVVRGMYVTGWSLRRFAFHLEETLKHDFVEEALKANDTRSKQPLVYVFVFAGRKVYGAPVTPLVSAQALEALDLPAKTEGGTLFHQELEIAGRKYGLAARRAKRMGETVGVAVLRSET